MSMKFAFSTDPAWEPLLQQEIRKLEAAAVRSMRQSARDLKAAWRQQIVQAGLGGKLARSIQGEAYPKRAVSLRAAAVVWSKARDEIIAPHETGALIRSSQGHFLAIPIFKAARMQGDRGRKITPAEYERRVGARLEVVLRPGKPALLVDKGDSFGLKGVGFRKQGPAAQRARARSRKKFFPVFVLVPQVRLKKRLNLAGEARRVANLVPSRFAAEFNRSR